jgi:hypothetical protein
MGEENEWQMKILRLGTKKLENDLARLTDRDALLRAEETLLLERRAPQLVVLDQRPHVDRAFDLSVRLRAGAFSEPMES